MALSKLDLALVAIAAVGLIWIEHNHRVVIGSLSTAEAPGPAPAGSLCPDTDDAPMSAACIKFIGAGALPVVRPQPPAAPAMLSLPAPPCPPGNESAPDGDSVSAICQAIPASVIATERLRRADTAGRQSARPAAAAP
jgi:hypothetical protein